MVELLLAASAQPDTRSNDGCTPLHLCAAQRQQGSVGARCCAALLDAGADARSQAPGGQTALSLALRSRAWAAAGVLGAAAPPHDPAGVDSAVSAGRTPLHNAAFIGDSDAVSFLLERRADPGSKDGAGRTALHAAAAYGSTQTVVHLLRAPQGGGAALAGVADANGATALHAAAQSGQAEVIRLLLGQDGVDEGARDRSGRSPADCAREMAASGDPAAADALSALAGLEPQPQPEPKLQPQPKPEPAGPAAGGVEVLRVVLVEETAFLQGKQRLLRLQAVDGQPAAPAPAHIAGFLARLCSRLSPCVGSLSARQRRELSEGMAALGWDPARNRPVAGSAGPPTLDAVLAQLHRWVAAVATDTADPSATANRQDARQAALAKYVHARDAPPAARYQALLAVYAMPRR